MERKEQPDNDKEKKTASAKRILGYVKPTEEEKNTHKRIIGHVISTEEVKPRKRIKIIVPRAENHIDIDYKGAFEKVVRIVRAHAGQDCNCLPICTACLSVAEPCDTIGWVTCRHCKQDLCAACLPSHEPNTKTQVTLFYCEACREHTDETPDVEGGYQIMTVGLGGIMSLMNK
jgi:hypothetical protein